MARRYTTEEKAEAVRLVHARRAELGTSRGTVKHVADQLGCSVSAVTAWVRQADQDPGSPPARREQTGNGEAPQPAGDHPGMSAGASDHGPASDEVLCGGCGQPLVASPHARPSSAEPKVKASPLRRWLGRSMLLLVAAALLAAIGRTVLVGNGNQEDLTGMLVLTAPDRFVREGGYCLGTGRYNDFGPGMVVTIRDGDDKILGITSTVAYDGGRLRAETATLVDVLLEDRCVVTFALEVPATADLYVLEIGKRVALRYSKADLVENGWFVAAPID